MRKPTPEAVAKATLTDELGRADLQADIATDIAEVLANVVTGETELIVDERGDEQREGGEGNIEAVYRGVCDA